MGDQSPQTSQPHGVIIVIHSVIMIIRSILTLSLILVTIAENVSDNTIDSSLQKRTMGPPKPSHSHHSHGTGEGHHYPEFLRGECHDFKERVVL